MTGLAEISSLFMHWKHCVKLAKLVPISEGLQKNAAKAQADLILYQALYWNGIKP